MASPSDHHLLLMLGVGPQSDDPDRVRRREYRRTEYAMRPGGPRVSTPFVGEAIVRLQPGQFTHVHIFGTANSMWDTLLFHALDAVNTDSAEVLAQFDVVNRTVSGARLDEDDSCLSLVETAVGALLSVPVSCHVIPLGLTADEQWAMLAALDRLEFPDPVALSIDVTHGLRISPLFLLLAIQYLAAVRPGVTVADAFYGAYEVRDRPGGDGATPIISLKPFLKLAAYIDAATALARSADASRLAGLLGKSASAKALSDAARAMTSALQNNGIPLLGGAARSLDAALEAYPGGNVPLDLIRGSLADLARVADGQSAWQSLLSVAGHHARHGRSGLALLAAYEGVRARMAVALGYKPERLNRTEHEAIDSALSKAPAVIHSLRRDRNLVAHASLAASKADMRRMEALRRDVPGLLKQVSSVLDSDAFDSIAAG